MYNNIDKILNYSTHSIRLHSTNYSNLMIINYNNYKPGYDNKLNSKIDLLASGCTQMQYSYYQYELVTKVTWIIDIDLDFQYAGSPNYFYLRMYGAYNPTFRRFINCDSIGTDSNINLYVLVENNLDDASEFFGCDLIKRYTNRTQASNSSQSGSIGSGNSSNLLGNDRLLCTHKIIKIHSRWFVIPTRCQLEQFHKQALTESFVVRIIAAIGSEILCRTMVAHKILNVPATDKSAATTTVGDISQNICRMLLNMVETSSGANPVVLEKYMRFTL